VSFVLRVTLQILRRATKVRSALAELIDTRNVFPFMLSVLAGHRTPFYSVVSVLALLFDICEGLLRFRLYSTNPSGDAAEHGEESVHTADGADAEEVDAAADSMEVKPEDEDEPTAPAAKRARPSDRVDTPKVAGPPPRAKWQRWFRRVRTEVAHQCVLILSILNQRFATLSRLPNAHSAHHLETTGSHVGPSSSSGETSTDGAAASEQTAAVTKEDFAMLMGKVVASLVHAVSYLQGVSSDQAVVALDARPSKELSASLHGSLFNVTQALVRGIEDFTRTHCHEPWREVILLNLDKALSTHD